MNGLADSPTGGEQWGCGTTPIADWSPWHERLHRQLRRHPHRLPDGASLLLAVSGGQDSMVLLALMKGLQRLHNWSLHIWHGDHGWHTSSINTAAELRDWCSVQGMTIVVDRAGSGQVVSEAAARRWRYRQLAIAAAQLSQEQPQQPCCHILTGHTASDKAETILLNLARGTDLAGLTSLLPERSLDAAQPNGPKLVRPLLDFSRQDTTTISRDLALPVWPDPSNINSGFRRNRIRLEVLPVLESLYPGCSCRLARLANRLLHTHSTQTALALLALRALQQNEGLDRRGLAALPINARCTVLATWLRQHQVANLNTNLLEELVDALRPGVKAGSRDLREGWRICWQGNWVQLHRGMQLN